MAQATGSKTSAKTGVITLGRRQWAVGLSWQLADARDTAVRKAKEQAARNGNTLRVATLLQTCLGLHSQTR